MLCPNEVKLSAFAEGELAPRERQEVEEHVAHCARCAQAVQRDGRLVAALRGHWHVSGDEEPAAGCLSDEELAAFVDGSLPAVKRPYAERHLSECDRCIAGVADLYRALKTVGALPAGGPARRADAQSRARLSFTLRDLRLALSGAAAVLIILAGGYFLTYGGAKRPMEARMAMRAAPEAAAREFSQGPAPALSRRAAPVQSEEAEKALGGMRVAPPDHEALGRLEQKAQLGQAAPAAGRARNGKALAKQPSAAPPAEPRRVDAVVAAESPAVPGARPEEPEREGGMPGPTVALKATPTPGAMAGPGLAGARGGAGGAGPQVERGPVGERGPQGPPGPMGGMAADHLAPAAAEPSMFGAPAEAQQAAPAAPAAMAPGMARRARPSPPENLNKAAKDAPDDPQPQLALAMWYLQNGYLIEGRARVAAAQQLLARERARTAQPAAGKPGAP